MEGALRMILVSERCAKQCENTVASGLRDIAAITVYRFHHQLQHRVDYRPRLLGIEIADQLGRAFDVGEQRGNYLALAVDGPARARR